ncbi:MAG: ATP-binding protein [Betaproteobacteria bacterium]
MSFKTTWHGIMLKVVIFKAMKYANEIFFFVVALVLWGLLFGSRSILKLGEKNQPKVFSLIALTFSATSFTLFAVASTISLALITLANTCFVASFFYLGLFCRSLNRPIARHVQIVALMCLLTFGVIFEYLRQNGVFIERVALVTLVGIFCFIWELIELRRLEKKHFTQLRFLFFTIGTELVLSSVRLCALYFDTGPSPIALYQEGVISSAIRWAWLGMAILSYVAILSYWMEKITIENFLVVTENEKITELLKEKESLIYRLMKANKTSATGALSASIAHELNQPLGASNLNIQFLKMKLEKGVINPELGKEILDSLEEDNKRAATIVKSLRSIFTDVEANAQEVQLGDLISNVLDIVKPELKSKDIQIQLRVDDGLAIKVNSAEIEQVILNLLNNAIQALANSGTLQHRIVIEAIKSGNSVNLSVSDNGTGVAPEFKHQLFELLSTTKQTGMGLGLWLCNHIVTRYGGSIHYEDAVGGGARFVLELRLAV